LKQNILKLGKQKNPHKKKVVNEFTSTDPYQFQPVLPRPSEYATFEHYYPQLNLPSSTVIPSSSLAPSKILKPTKKFNNFYLPTSTMSPSTTMTPKRQRKPSTTQAPFKNFKSFTSPSTVAHFSTTKAPDYFKYSTPTTSAPMKIHESFYIHPSTASTLDTNVQETKENVVVIKPKTNFINMESSEPIEETKERIIYRFVPEFHTLNQTNDNQNYFYQNFNESSLNEDEFLQNFHKNYNYEHFTEKDAGPLPMNDDYKFDQDTQRADKKAMIVQISNDDNDNYNRHHPLDLNERESPPPFRGDFDDEQDHEAEASKNQYLFLYSLDDEEKKQRSKPQKMKKGKSQEPDYFYHHHQHHYQNPKNIDEGDYDPEIDSEFDSDLLNSDNVRIVDPNVRGGRPLEFTKDDYLRHIKQAVVQYMKEHGQDTNTPNFKPKSQGPTKAALRAAQNSQQFKQLQQPMKLPKNVYTAGQLKEAIEDLRESPQVDFTTKRPKAKPIDLTALDVGQSYQHVSHFDHSAVLKNVEGFDQTNAMKQPKNPFSLQNYQDINNLKKPQFNEDSDDQQTKQQNLFKGYKLPQIKSYGQDQSSFSQMSYDSNKLPRLVRGQDEDDEEDNDVKDPVDSPIQIINGIPVANPYNIDLNTLK
jgi:hypothetical protein